MAFPGPTTTAFGHPYIRNVISYAQCQSGFDWMNNAEGNSPCLVVAYVIAACVGNSWTQPVLPSGYSYDPPTGGNATPCYCSWSCYNLMMACAWCQYPNGTSIASWTAFSENCPTSYTDAYFPSGYTLQSNQTIPYWAVTDPASWPSGIFDPAQASQILFRNEADFSPTAASSSGSKSPDLGAIIGEVVGGAAFVLIVAVCTYFLCKRHQSRRVKVSSAGAVTNGAMEPSWQQHARLPSDMTTSFLRSGTVSPAPMSYYTGPSAATKHGTNIATPSMYSSFPTSPPQTDAAPFTTNPQQRTPAIPII